MWRPVHRASGKVTEQWLTEEEKAQWEKHPLTKNIYRFVFEEERVKKEPPFEAKEFTAKVADDPKKPSIEKVRTNEPVPSKFGKTLKGVKKRA